MENAMFCHPSVKGRCAIDLDALTACAKGAAVEAALEEMGFIRLSVGLVPLARSLIGSAGYRRGARADEAPGTVDCSSFVKWLFAQLGIWMPRRSVQQRRMGAPVAAADVAAGDLVFTAGCVEYYEDDPADGVGHVALATGEGTVVHAVNRRKDVVEGPLGSLLAADSFRGARRIIPAGSDVRTYAVPPELEVETSDDVRWLVLQRLHRP